METLYRKVAVSERLPEKEKDYFFMKRGGFDFQLETYRITKEKFFKNGFNYWLEEIPETIKSETLANALHRIEKLKEDKKELMSLLYDCKIVIDMHRQIHGFVGASEQLYEDIESLIQKMKQ